MLFETLQCIVSTEWPNGTIHPNFGMSQFIGSLKNVLVKSFPTPNSWRQDPDLLSSKTFENGSNDILALYAAHLSLARRAVLDTNSGIHQPKGLMNLR